MDCNAGGLIGQNLMRSGMPMMDHHDPTMMGMEADGLMEAPHAEWAADFHHHDHSHHHHQAAAMAQAEHMAQEFEAMMMEEAFAAQQQQQQHGGAEMTEQQVFDDAYHGDDWLGQFEAPQSEGEAWAQDYADEDVQVFTVEGEPLRTVEEKTHDSQFYGFLEKIRKKELLIDEEKGEVVAGPGPDAAEAEWQTEFAAAQQAAATTDDNVMEEAWKEHEEAQDDAYRAAWGSDEADEDYAARFLGGEGEESDQWLKEYEDMQQNFQNAQDSTDYPFEPNNPFLFHDDPFMEGLELQRAGTLAEAVLAFEAACQKDLTREDAWRCLGCAQAENEKDQLAIRALNKARELNPKDVQVHAALSVSHTNECNHAQALRALRDWLLAHAEYEHLGSVPLHDSTETPHAEDDYTSQFLFVSPSEHRDCYTLFQAAVQMNPQDADLHSSLGVLKNLSHEYDEAATHFREALQYRPEDPKLWNKLGATLANGNRSREALAAYDKALDINPGYVRAQYNLGIAHSNLGEHTMAAKHLLRAIVMQQGGVANAENGSGGGGRSTREMWDVLRMTLNLMDRSDLVDLTWKQDVVPFLPEFGLEDLL